MNRRNLFRMFGLLPVIGVAKLVVPDKEYSLGDLSTERLLELSKLVNIEAENDEWPFVECGARMHYGEDGSVTVNLGYSDAAHS